MDKVKILKEKLEMLDKLIAKTEDEKELKAFIAQRDETMIEIGKQTAADEAEQKAIKKEMETKAAAATVTTPRGS